MDLKDIQEAHLRIKSVIHRTPVLTCSTLNDLLDAELFFKCENFQKVGAFKFRGASNAVMSLSEAEAKRGVATHSSGNHAQALALAAKMRHIPAFIVMPNNSPDVKKNAVAGYGGQITFCEPTLAAREKTLKEIVNKTGAVFIPPYNDPRIIAGQGTAALELLDEVNSLDVMIAPVGGGGLLAGTAIAAKGLKPNIKVFGAEPANADDAFRSFRDGIIQPSVNPKTIADGLLTSLGELNFAIIKQNVDGILTATESEIKQAMRFIWERMKILVEPSAAISLAVLLSKNKNISNKRVGLILSGGNIDLQNALRILSDL